MLKLEGWFLLSQRGVPDPHPRATRSARPRRRAAELPAFRIQSEPGPACLSPGAQSFWAWLHSGPYSSAWLRLQPKPEPGLSLTSTSLRPPANHRPRISYGPALGPAPAQSRAWPASAPPSARPAVGARRPGRHRPQTLGTADPRATRRGPAAGAEWVGRGRAGPGAVWGPGGGRAGGRRDGLHRECRGQGGG